MHRYYFGKTSTGILYSIMFVLWIITPNILSQLFFLVFGIGCVIDLFLISRMVRQANLMYKELSLDFNKQNGSKPF